jgi:hypothetical protein
MIPLLDVPAPLDDGQLVYLRLPRSGLSTHEADRLGAMLQAYVVTPSCRTCWHRMSYDRQRGTWRCHSRHGLRGHKAEQRTAQAVLLGGDA